MAQGSVAVEVEESALAEPVAEGRARLLESGRPHRRYLGRKAEVVVEAEG